MKAWLVSILLVVVAFGFVLGDCRSTAANRIVLWHAYRGAEEQALLELTARYEAQTGTTVEVLAVPFLAYASKLSSAIERDQGPDVFIDAHERLGSYRDDGLVVHADAAFPKDDNERYDAIATKVARDDEGVAWGVPFALKGVALILNTSLVEGAPDSIESLVKSRNDGAYPLAYEAESAYVHAPWLHAFGGSMLGPNDAYGFTGEPARKSVLFARSLVSSGLVPASADGALVKQLFESGKAAAIIGGPGLVSELPKGLPLRVMPLPRMHAAASAPEPFLTVELLFLAPRSVARPEVSAFARFLASDESARTRVRAQVVANAATWKGAEAIAPHLRAFHDAALASRPMSTRTAMRATWEPVEQAIRSAMRAPNIDTASLDAILVESARRFESSKPKTTSASKARGFTAVAVTLFAAALVAYRSSRPRFWSGLRASAGAYAYVMHAAIAVFVLVVLPLIAGAVTSFFSGPRNHMTYAGIGNYVDILTARGGPLLGYGSFYRTLLVTIVWTIANVTLHVTIGLALALLLSRPLLRLRGLYRTLLIVPWAVPSYVTALAYKGMFHQQFGAVNALLRKCGAEPVSWFSHFSTAFAANVATNVWLGFPFMMVVILGALTNVPKDVLEAADVDGATSWQRFRHVTLPLLLPQLAPAIVLGAVWTFNMFNVVFLVSGGEPDNQTDILVSEAYRWAFTRHAQYGYAAAYAVLIFGILWLTSRLSRRWQTEVA